MASVTIHTFLVQPGKNQNPSPKVSGKKVSGSGKLVDLLANIFHAQPDRKDFEITFRPAPDGKQQNDCRDLIVRYQSSPTLTNARAIAQRLQDMTDKRSGMGLLFVMTGQHGTKYRTVISRFPANEGIVAEVASNRLDVAFLEQVFIRQMSAYKAVLLEDASPKSLYWSGFATDRQAGSSPENMSTYWLDDFLTADFSETPKAGTNRLATALRQAVKVNPNLSVKAEIAAAVSLAKSVFKNRTTSIDDFCTHFGFSQQASDSIKNQLAKPALSSKRFKFDVREFEKTVPYRSIEMENGAILTAPTGEFENVFDVTPQKGGEVTYSTTGKVADERMARK